MSMFPLKWGVALGALAALLIPPGISATESEAEFSLIAVSSVVGEIKREILLNFEADPNFAAEFTRSVGDSLCMILGTVGFDSSREACSPEVEPDEASRGLQLGGYEPRVKLDDLLLPIRLKMFMARPITKDYLYQQTVSFVLSYIFTGEFSEAFVFHNGAYICRLFRKAFDRSRGLCVTPPELMEGDTASMGNPRIEPSPFADAALVDRSAQHFSSKLFWRDRYRNRYHFAGLTFFHRVPGLGIPAKISRWIYDDFGTASTWAQLTKDSVFGAKHTKK